MKLNYIKECVDTIRENSLASKYRDMAVIGLSKPVLEAEVLAGKEIARLLCSAEKAATEGKMSIASQLFHIDSMTSFARRVFITNIIEQLSAHGFAAQYYPNASPALISISWEPKALSEPEVNKCLY